MPIYQYDCSTCKKRVDVFFRSISRVTDPVCPECGGKELKRVISKVLRARSDAERISSIDINQEMAYVNSRDVGEFAKWAKKMGRRYDSALGSDFNQLAAKAENGEDPVERIDAAHTLRYRVSKALGEATRPKRNDDPPPSDDPFMP